MKFNKELKNINKNSNEYLFIQKKLLDANQIKPIYNFSIINKINDLNDHRYLCTLKPDNSIDCLLLFTNYNKNNKIYLIIDKSYYQIILKVDSSLYTNDTILSGYIHKKYEAYTLMLDRIIVYNGNFFIKNPLGRHLQELHNIIKKKYKYDSFLNPFYISLRSFFTINYIDYIKKYKDLTVLFYPDIYKNYQKIYVLNVDKENNEIIKPSESQKEFIVRQDVECDEIYKLYDINTNDFVNLLDIYSNENKQNILKEKINNKKILCSWNDKRKSWVYL